MNILSIAGLATAVYCIWWTLIDISGDAGVDPSVYWSPASAMTVIGGSIGATLLKSSMADFKAGLLLFPQAFKNGAKPTELIEQLIDFAGIARKNGLIALESQEIKDKFLNKAVQQLVDGSKPEVMQKTLQSESDAQLAREKHGIGMWSYMGEVFPAMGMVGTLIGLVALLSNMQDMESLGTSMAVALLTTFYGAVAANAICLPIAAKMKVQSEVAQINREIVIEGTMFIQAGGNPRILGDMLSSFIPPDQVKHLSFNS